MSRYREIWVPKYMFSSWGHSYIHVDILKHCLNVTTQKMLKNCKFIRNIEN